MTMKRAYEGDGKTVVGYRGIIDSLAIGTSDTTNTPCLVVVVVIEDGKHLRLLLPIDQMFELRKFIDHMVAAMPDLLDHEEDS